MLNHIKETNKSATNKRNHRECMYVFVLTTNMCLHDQIIIGDKLLQMIDTIHGTNKSKMLQKKVKFIRFLHRSTRPPNVYNAS